MYRHVIAFVMLLASLISGLAFVRPLPPRGKGLMLLRECREVTLSIDLCSVTVWGRCSKLCTVRLQK